VFAGIAIVAVACDGGNDDDGPTGNTGSIQVAVTPAAASMNQGDATFVTVSLTRVGGYTGAVTITIAGLPGGVSATMDPPQLNGANTTSRIDLTAAPTASVSTATVTVAASGQGVTTATATFQMTVGAAPDFALVVAPPTITIPAGESGNASIQIARTNTNEAIALALVTPPPGITAMFDPAPATASTSAIAISVAPSVPPGNYPITIQGTASSLPNRSTVVSITVVPAPPSGNNITYYFCNVDDIPAFLAFQDGSGAWQPVTGVSSGGTTMYSFNITQGRGGVLSVYQYSLESVAGRRAPSRALRWNRTTVASRLGGARSARLAGARTQAAVGDAYETYVLYGSPTELAQDGVESCAQAEPPTKTVRGTFVGVAPGQYGIASLGSATVIFDGAAATNPVTFHDVPAGGLDLVASRIVMPGMAPDRLVLMRNLDVPDGGSLPQSIDYNGPASIVPATATANVSGAVSGDLLEIYVDVLTVHGSNQLWSDLAPSAATARPWAGLGSANMLSSDLHRLWAFASRSTPTTLDFRVMTKTVGPVSNQELALGDQMSAPATSMVSGGAYPRFRFQGSIPPDYNKGVSIDVVGEDDGSSALYVLASGAYLAASGTPAGYDLTMPDVAGLPGFPVDSRRTTGVNGVLLALHGFTGPGLYEPRPTLGAESRGAFRGLTINVP
jgi:hypothetical protein